MEAKEYENEFFRRQAFKRQVCKSCGQAFWSTGNRERCAEVPCNPYAFIGNSPIAKPYTVDEFRETYFRYFEERGHKRIARFPVVPRWRDDVFFVQASIYDFQPWVTSGAVEPPANPLVISQPCLRFSDVAEVGVSGRHTTAFEMLAHHAFNGMGKEIYFKDRTVELCHEFLTSQLGVQADAVTYKEEVWEGGGDMGPSLSVGLHGLEVATLVFMQYSKKGDVIKPLPLRIVDTGYGLERFTWVSQGTKTIYDAVFKDVYRVLPSGLPPEDMAVLVDHSRSFILMLTDGVVPSNAKEGYLARMLLRRMFRVLARRRDYAPVTTVMEAVVQQLSRTMPGLDVDIPTLRDIVELEERRFKEALDRGRSHVRKLKERLGKQGKTIGVDDLLTLYDSMGLTPDVVLEEAGADVKVPPDFFAMAAKLHEGEAHAPGSEGGSEPGNLPPDPPEGIPPTQVLYHLDPYTLRFSASVVWSDPEWVILDRTYFYPTGGGQITDVGKLGPAEVVDVVRKGPWVFHRVSASPEGAFSPGSRVEGEVSEKRRRQLMQHHTATHILNGAMRKVLGPHIWQSGAYKGLEEARLDVTHYKSLTPAELHEIDRLVNVIVRENRPVKSSFMPRTKAEAQYGFTIYQGGAVPGKDLRIVDIDNFDVEACGGTHCTHTSEVGYIKILSTERIQDGMVRLHFAAGDRALEAVEEQDQILKHLSQKLAAPPSGLVAAVDSLLARVKGSEKATRLDASLKMKEMAERLLGSAETAVPVGRGYVAVKAVVPLGPEELKELARELTRNKNVIALIGAQSSGIWTVFFASGTPEVVSASALLDEVQKTWPGKGGGNASAARASGPSGEALLKLLEVAVRATSTRLAANPAG